VRAKGKGQATLDVAWQSKKALNSARTKYASIWYSSLQNDQLEDFRIRVDDGIEDVSSYLRSAPPSGLQVYLSDRPSLPIAYRDGAAILIPADRLPDRTAIVHELTHIIAGAGQHPGGILDEGLAVYLQSKFGGPGDRSFPTGGRNLHEETVRMTARCRRRLPLAMTIEIRRKFDRGPARTLAYLESGSFVQFLIDGQGLDALMRVYHGTTSWAEAYGCGMEMLETLWFQELSLCKERAPQPPQ
jgi:hypothetical protein